MGRVLKYIIFTIFIIFILAMISFFIIKDNDQKLRDILLENANIISASIDINKLKSLSTTESNLESPIYQDLKKQLFNIRKSNDSYKYLYLLGMKKDTGTVFFYVDSQKPESPNYVRPGEIYYEVSDEYLKAFTTKKKMTVGPVSDRWGTMITALIPIVDANNDELIAVLGLDILDNKWQEKVYMHSLPSIGIIVIVILSAIILFLFKQKSTRKIKASEESLRESEHKLSSLFNAMTDIVIEMDYDGKYINIAPTSSELLIMSPNELTGKTLHEVFPKTEADTFLKFIRTTIDQNTALTIEYQLEIDNKLYWFEGKATPKTENTVLYIARDVTKQHKQQEELKQRLDFISFTNKLSTNFISIGSDKLETAITDLLKVTAKFAAIERGYLFQFTDNREKIELTHEWCADNVKTHKGILDSINVSDFEDFVATLERGESIQLHTAELENTPENRAMLEILDLLEIKSFINIPIINDNTLVGYIGFDSTIKQTDWTKGMMDSFEFCVLIIANTIQRLQNESRIKSSLREKNVLIQEIYHRTKNNMAVISAMISIQSRHSENDYVKSTFREITNKIQAMALVHQKLYKAKDLSNINLKDYIEDLANLIMQSYGVLSERVQINFDLQDVKILIDSAVPLGLIINELVSNIFKHAFPENNEGNIFIRLFKEEDETINLELNDDGIGFPKNFDPRKDGSLGLISVFSIAENQLKGEIFVKSENGIKWHIRIKDDKKKERV